MTTIQRTERLQPSELQALFGEEKDYSCSLAEIVNHTECEEDSGCENTAESVCELSSPSDHDYERPCGVSDLQKQFLSNQDYYTKLEDLKREHLRNIAELEKLYLSQLTPAGRERELISSRTERRLSINRENEDDTESEQIEKGGKVQVGCLKNGVSHLRSKARQDSLEEDRKVCRSQQSSSYNAANQVKEDPPDNLRRDSKVTIPKPFHMMLREEERKRRNVKTRSEVELENEILRKELDELKECGKKFRARPAPPSTHVQHRDIINKRPKKLHGQKNQGHHGNHHQQGSQIHAPPLPQRPFSFIERERKKREKKLTDELNNLTSKEEQRVFKARPVPRSLYRSGSPSYHMYRAVSPQTRERDNHRPNSALPSSILEDTLQEVEDSSDNKYYNEFSRPHSRSVTLCNSSFWKWKNKQLEEETERKRSRERDRDWSYIHPLRRASFCHSQELLNTGKSDYISV